MNNETIAGFCPGCNKVVAAEVRGWAHGQPSRDLFDRLDPEEEGLRSTVKYKVAFCPACHGVFLQRSWLTEPSEFRYEEMVYPKQSKLPLTGLPDEVRRSYESALSCFDTGNYEPCVIMCRKCLEAVCMLLGESSGSLQKRLIRLRDKGDVEPKLYSWADELRLIGNDAAHDFKTCISKDDAHDTLEFLEALLLYVFVLDRRFQSFRQRRKRARSRLTVGDLRARFGNRRQKALNSGDIIPISAAPGSMAPPEAPHGPLSCAQRQ